MNRDPRVLLVDVARAGADIQSYSEVMERAMYLRNRSADFFDKGISFDRSSLHCGVTHGWFTQGPALKIDKDARVTCFVVEYEILVAKTFR